MNDTNTHTADDILFERKGRLGLITMNRPKALNALTHEMSLALDRQLKLWATDPKIAAVAIVGAGDRAFCAGGDIRALYQSGPKGELTQEFYWNEYRMNRRIFRYPKPYVALMNGITMGGGVGVSAPGRFRVVTEKTLLAMPETGIGLFPDVGASYYLSHMPGQFGIYLGLTGNRIQAADILYTGFATDFAPSTSIAAIASALESEAPDPVLERLAAPLDQVPPLKAHQAVIDRCFAGDTVEAIIAKLEKEGGVWADQVRTTLLEKSPMSLKVTLRELREAASLDFEDCMVMEYRLVQAFMADRDFFEGVRAVLIDKDNKPNWQPARLADVTPAMVDAYFRKLPHDLTFED
jgi:enoyl-CoA hydratase